MDTGGTISIGVVGIISGSWSSGRWGVTYVVKEVSIADSKTISGVGNVIGATTEFSTDIKGGAGIGAGGLGWNGG